MPIARVALGKRRKAQEAAVLAFLASKRPGHRFDVVMSEDPAIVANCEVLDVDVVWGEAEDLHIRVRANLPHREPADLGFFYKSEEIESTRDLLMRLWRDVPEELVRYHGGPERFATDHQKNVRKAATLKRITDLGLAALARQA